MAEEDREGLGRRSGKREKEKDGKGGEGIGHRGWKGDRRKGGRGQSRGEGREKAGGGGVGGEEE